MLHSILERNRDLVAVDDSDSDIRELIDELGPAPAQVTTAENHLVGLELREKRNPNLRVSGDDKIRYETLVDNVGLMPQ